MRRTLENSWLGFKVGQVFYLFSGRFRPIIASPPRFGYMVLVILGHSGWGMILTIHICVEQCRF